MSGLGPQGKEDELAHLRCGDAHGDSCSNEAIETSTMRNFKVGRWGYEMYTSMSRCDGELHPTVH